MLSLNRWLAIVALLGLILPAAWADISVNATAQMLGAGCLMNQTTPTVNIECSNGNSDSFVRGFGDQFAGSYIVHAFAEVLPPNPPTQIAIAEVFTEIGGTYVLSGSDGTVSLLFLGAFAGGGFSSCFYTLNGSPGGDCFAGLAFSVQEGIPFDLDITMRATAGSRFNDPSDARFAYQLSSDAGTITTVPEPASIYLLAFGGLTFLRRKMNFS